MTVIGPILFEIWSGNEVCVKTSKVHSSEPKVGQSSYTPKAQLDPLEVLCVKFEDNRTSTFRDMLRKRNDHERPNAVTSSFLPLASIHLINWLQRFYRITMSLRPFVPKSDVKQRFTTTTTATLHIEFRLKFKPVHYSPGSNSHTKNCYPSFFSYKVTGKEEVKTKAEAESIAPSVSPTVTAGANNRKIGKITPSG